MQTQVIITQLGREDVYGTYPTPEEAERIAEGLRSADWVSTVKITTRVVNQAGYRTDAA